MSARHSNEDGSHTKSEGSGMVDKAESAFGGVKNVESRYPVFVGYSRYILFVALSLLLYLCSLDNSTTSSYTDVALYQLNVLLTERRTVLNTVNAVYVIPIAVEPIFARIADVKSRGWALSTSLICYVLGYIIVAAAPDGFNTLAAGLVINSFGYAGLRLLSAIILSDNTTIEWRGLAMSAISLLTIINDFVGWKIADVVEIKPGWRWGFGMFTIIVPVVVAPILFVVFKAESQVIKVDGLDTNLPPQTFPAYFTNILRFDVIGLLLLAASIILVLFPFNFPITANTNSDSFWKDQSMIAMLICGILLVPIFAIWEKIGAKHPVISRAVAMNWTLLVAAFVVFLDSFAYWLFFYYFEPVLGFQKPKWTAIQLSNFAAIHNISIPLFGFVAGIGMRVFRRYKPFLILGLAIRTIGIVITIASRGGDAADHVVLAAEILQGIGSGFVFITALIAAQLSVPYINLSIVTAIIFIARQAGGIIGSGIAVVVYTVMLPGKIKKYIPKIAPDELDDLVQNFHYPDSWPEAPGSALLQAYTDILRTLAIIATAVSIFAFIFSLTIHGTYLGDMLEEKEKKGKRSMKRRRSLMIENM